MFGRGSQGLVWFEPPPIPTKPHAKNIIFVDKIAFWGVWGRGQWGLVGLSKMIFSVGKHEKICVRTHLPEYFAFSKRGHIWKLFTLFMKMNGLIKIKHKKNL